MRPVLPVRLTFYYETCVFLYVFTHAGTFPADMFPLSYHRRATMYLMQTILFSISTISIFNIITSTLIVGFVNVMTDRMAQKIHVIVFLSGFILNLSLIFFSTSRCDGSECLTNRRIYCAVMIMII